MPMSFGDFAPHEGRSEYARGGVHAVGQQVVGGLQPIQDSNMRRIDSNTVYAEPDPPPPPDPVDLYPTVTNDIEDRTRKALHTLERTHDFPPF